MRTAFAAFVAIVVALTTVAAAQTNTGEVAGVVMDASGGVLPGATVTATHQVSGTIVTRITDGEGRSFSRRFVSEMWDLTVVLARFATQTRTTGGTIRVAVCST